MCNVEVDGHAYTISCISNCGIMQIGMVGYCTISNVLVGFEAVEHCAVIAMSLFFSLLRATRKHNYLMISVFCIDRQLKII